MQHSSIINTTFSLWKEWIYTVTVNRSVLIERWYTRIFKRYFCFCIKHIAILTRNHTPSHKVRLVIGLTHTSSFRWRENNVFDVYLMCRVCVCACVRVYVLPFLFFFFFFLSSRFVSIPIKKSLIAIFFLRTQFE